MIINNKLKANLINSNGRKNRKAEISSIAKALLWVLVFIIASAGIYFLIKKFEAMG